MSAEAPKVLCDLWQELAARDPGAGGAVWRLAEPGRQLDANLVRLPPSRRIDTHTEPDLDVLLVVLEGSGSLTAPAEQTALAAGAVAWLPRGSTRSLIAGPGGLTYLTVHRRRPGMQIGRAAAAAGGAEPAQPANNPFSAT